MKKLFFMLIFSTLFPMTSAFAVKVSNLYQAEVKVATQSAEERTDATKRGLIQVLVKVSGNPQVDKNPVIKPMLQRADYYVQEFSYSQPSTSSSEYLLKIHYSKFDINKLLQKAEVPSWGENRPLVLVWLLMTNTHDHMEIVGNDSPLALLDLMKQQGKKFGLPLLFPMMDVADVDQISIDDIETMSLPALKKASKRYAPDALLIGNVQQANNGYESKWLLVLGDNQWDWVITGNTTESVISSVVNQASQMLAKHYVVKSGSTAQFWLTLEIHHITAHKDLEQLMQQLKALAPVQEVDLSQVAGDTVTLSVLLRGSLDTFQQNASLGQHLVLKSQDVSSNKLIYDWVN